MSEMEYRVVWQRENQSRLATRRYARRATAERLMSLLTGDPHRTCTHDGGFGEPPYCYWETGGGDGSVPPFVVQPRIEERTVGPWAPR